MLKFLIEKEFKQLSRDKVIPRLIVMLTLLVMFVFPWAADQEIKNVKLHVVDRDRSSLSERLVQKVVSSGYFRLSGSSASYDGAMPAVERGDADMIMEIPSGFERDLMRGETGRLLLAANAVNGTKGGLATSYMAAIVADYSADLRAENGLPALSSAFKVESSFRFNPRLDYKVFMLPALMVMLMTLLAGFLPALNIVAEKESGTIEQINVTPVPKTLFVLAKLIPYWIIGFVVLSLCIALAALVYGIYPTGSLLTIYLFTMVYIWLVSGMGLVISNYSDTIQQAMFVMFFFIMVFILMSGLFTPVSSMPQWAQAITAINPLKYFMQVMRQVYLKGSSFMELLPQFFALCSFAVVLSVWAVVSYKKST